MKKLLCCLAMLPAASFAQKIELGLAGGISMNGKPSGNMPFKADKTAINYVATLTGLYNINNYIQAGLEVGASGLSGKTTITYTDVNGNPIKSEDKRFVYAKKALTLSAVANGKLSMGNGYGYAGIAIGYAGARHDSKKLNDNEIYRAPDGGNGLLAGLQIGYVNGITKRLALSAQAALRYYSLRYDAHVGAGETLKYNIIAFPLTVGIRYMLFSSETKEKERQDIMNHDDPSQ